MSSISKAIKPRRFSVALNSFKILPYNSSGQAALGIIVAEILIAVLLLSGWYSKLAAFLGSLLLIIFTTAIVSKLLRGHKYLECGCFGAEKVQKINFKFINRNIILLLMAICVMFFGGGFFSLDNDSLLTNRFLVIAYLPCMLSLVGVAILFLLAQRLYRLLLFS